MNVFDLVCRCCLNTVSFIACENHWSLKAEFLSIAAVARFVLVHSAEHLGNSTSYLEVEYATADLCSSVQEWGSGPIRGFMATCCYVMKN